MTSSGSFPERLLLQVLAVMFVLFLAVGARGIVLPTLSTYVIKVPKCGCGWVVGERLSFAFTLGGRGPHASGAGCFSLFGGPIRGGSCAGVVVRHLSGHALRMRCNATRHLSGPLQVQQARCLGGAHGLVAAWHCG